MKTTFGGGPARLGCSSSWCWSTYPTLMYSLQKQGFLIAGLIKGYQGLRNPDHKANYVWAGGVWVWSEGGYGLSDASVGSLGPWNIWPTLLFLRRPDCDFEGVEWNGIDEWYLASMIKWDPYVFFFGGVKQAGNGFSAHNSAMFLVMVI